MLKEDLGNIAKMLEAEKVAVPNNSLLGFLSQSHDSVGPSCLQGSVATDGVKFEEITCVLTHFDESAESYVQVRMPSCLIELVTMAWRTEEHL